MNAPQIWVPATFWDDHKDRCPYDDEHDMPAEVSRSGRRVLIQPTAAGLHGLRSDAAYYADLDNMDECPRHIRSSAARTLAILGGTP